MQLLDGAVSGRWRCPGCGRTIFLAHHGAERVVLDAEPVAYLPAQAGQKPTEMLFTEQGRAVAAKTGEDIPEACEEFWWGFRLHTAICSPPRRHVTRSAESGEQLCLFESKGTKR